MSHCKRLILKFTIFKPVLCYIILLYHIISHHIKSYHIISYIISYHIIYHIISYIISYPILSYRVLSYPVISYPILSCPSILFLRINCCLIVTLQLPTQDVYNPYFIKSNLFKFFVSKTVKNNPTSRGNRRKFQAPQVKQIKTNVL